MGEKKEKPKIHVDDDWKKQAQEEKEKLAKQEAAEKQTKKALSI